MTSVNIYFILLSGLITNISHSKNKMNAYINRIEYINLEASCISQRGFSESSCDKDKMVKIEKCSSGIVTYEDIKLGEFH